MPYPELRLLQEEYNSSAKKIKSKSIVYEKDAVSNNFVRAMNAISKLMCGSTTAAYDEGTSYKIYSYLLRPKTETEIFYDPSTTAVWQSTATNCTYTGKKLIRDISFVNSDGKTMKTEFKYPFDFSGISDYTQMTNNNILSPLIEKLEYKNSQFLEKTTTEYVNWGNNIFAPKFIKLQGTASSALESRVTYHK